MTRNDEEDLEAYLERRRKAKEKANNGNGFGLSLPMALKMLPTPRTSDTNGPGIRGQGGMDLRTAISLLPSPAAGEAKLPNHPLHISWRIRAVQAMENGEELPQVVGGPKGKWSNEERLLPTPTSRDYKGRNQRNDDSCLPGAIQQNVVGENTSKP
jgi:hypothetical protein